MNDDWLIKFLDNYPTAILHLYTPWGLEVFQSKGVYFNSWDGTFNKLHVPKGTYYYVIHLGDGSTMTGYVAIIR